MEKCSSNNSSSSSSSSSSMVVVMRACTGVAKEVCESVKGTWTPAGVESSTWHFLQTSSTGMARWPSSTSSSSSSSSSIMVLIWELVRAFRKVLVWELEGGLDVSRW